MIVFFSLLTDFKYYFVCKLLPEQKIDMTVPVLKKITPGAGPFCETTTDMSFYVTKEFQGSPPTPSAEDVHVTHLPAQRVVVR